MKSLHFFMISVIVLLLAGCTTTTETFEYDAMGALVKRTVAQRSTADKIGDLVNDHSYVSIRKGWYASLSVATVTTESPVPGFDAEAGNITLLRVLLAKDQKSITPIMDMIRQVAGTDLSITAAGISGATAD